MRKSSDGPLRTFSTVFATSVKPDSNMVVNTNRGELVALSVHLFVSMLSLIPVLRCNAWVPVAPTTKRIQSAPSVGVLGAFRDEPGFDHQNVGGGGSGSKLFSCFLTCLLGRCMTQPRLLQLHTALGNRNPVPQSIC